jgi:predicted membrane-bound mannosyltransferase
MVVVYSAIPYKTPWCLLGFLHGMILLAGAGAAWLVRSCRGAVGKGLVAALLVAGATHLGWQAWNGSFRFAADPRNPYVYAHTGTDVFAIVQRLERLAQAHPEGAAMPLQVISRENLWPLPWYLRRFTRVEWWNGVSEQAKTAPVVLITPEMEEALVRKLYDLPPPGERELYVGMFARPVELRPGVEVRLYAANSLREELRRREAGPPPAGLARP